MFLRKLFNQSILIRQENSLLESLSPSTVKRYVHCTLYCSLFTGWVHCILKCTLYSWLCTIQCPLYCSLYCVQCALYSAMYTVCTQCEHSVHSALYSGDTIQ